MREIAIASRTDDDQTKIRVCFIERFSRSVCSPNGRDNIIMNEQQRLDNQNVGNIYSGATIVGEELLRLKQLSSNMSSFWKKMGMLSQGERDTQMRARVAT